MVNLSAGAIYECSVMHHRLTPKEHHFSYRVFYLWLDLDELDATSRSLWLLGRNRRNLFSIHDEDHFGGKAGSIRPALMAWLEGEGFDITTIAAVKMLSFPRVLGYGFNPVCFFFCEDAQGVPVCAVAEVTNTFREQKPYLLLNREENGRFRLITPKHFYVSPFSKLDLSFDFKLKIPGQKLEIHIDDVDAGRPVLLSALSGARRRLSDAALIACAFKYPLMTLRVIFLIHWHALVLWIKRIPFHRKAARSDLQKGVLKPHRTITNSPPSP